MKKTQRNFTLSSIKAWSSQESLRELSEYVYTHSLYPTLNAAATLSFQFHCRLLAFFSFSLWLGENPSIKTHFSFFQPLLGVPSRKRNDANIAYFWKCHHLGKSAGGGRGRGWTKAIETTQRGVKIPGYNVLIFIIAAIVLHWCRRVNQMQMFDRHVKMKKRTSLKC